MFLAKLGHEDQLHSALRMRTCGTKESPPRSHRNDLIHNTKFALRNTLTTSTIWSGICGTSPGIRLNTEVL